MIKWLKKRIGRSHVRSDFVTKTLAVFEPHSTFNLPRLGFSV